MLKEKFGFIGGGKMGEALCRGIINAGLGKAENIMVSDVVVERCQLLNKEIGVKTTQSNKDAATFADVIILAVKPQMMGDVLDQLKNDITTRHLVVSIAAGIPIRFIESRLQVGTRIIRVMPNTPCLIGVSATAFALGKCATDADGQLVLNLFNAVGKVFRLDEKYLDAVTGLSGSGPAYVYMFIEALSDGGVKMGLPRDVATILAAQTVMGAAKMVLETGQHPAQLKDAVTSPGGTTIEGLSKLEDFGFKSAVINAVEAATLKSKKLGELL
ncbi:MAG TPA: pyrroline-5-carboxylate reductase [Candidatus Wunengus sp. YC60]|uniref:pyrroline-5-carboxylate reductase n=1 Tax=Candidatus Wunengus sp. YC60 TaxID=3367697 RepID=UPI0040255417